MQANDLGLVVKEEIWLKSSEEVDNEYGNICRTILTEINHKTSHIANKFDNSLNSIQICKDTSLNL